MMSSTCFEPEGSSLGRRLYIQVWYSILHAEITIKGLRGLLEKYPTVFFYANT